MVIEYAITDPSRVAEFLGMDSLNDLEEIIVKISGDDDGDFVVVVTITDLPVDAGTLEEYLYEEEYDDVYDEIVNEYVEHMDYDPYVPF